MRPPVKRALILTAAALAFSGAALAQTPTLPPHGPLPNLWRQVIGWEQFPDRRTGAIAGMKIDLDGKSVWVAERCGQNSCLGSDLNPIMKLDTDGRVVKAFGAGLVVQPHGLFVDREGNIWVTDMGVDPATKRGAVVIKFSPEGEVLMTLGTPGVTGSDASHFHQPCDVLLGPDGSIYISDSHAGQALDAPPETNGRILKFDKDGRFIKAWGSLGSGPGQFRNPHALAMDAQGRLFVADRVNGRIQIFDGDGNFLTEWRQFGRPSGIAIVGDTIYVSDSESNTANNPGWRRGIWMGDVRTGAVTAFAPWLPDPNPDAFASGMEGVAVDRDGIIYGSSVYLRQYLPFGAWGDIRRFEPRP
jgi:sugar lactone lactonase YvrE